MKLKEIFAVVAIYMMVGLAACFFCACRLFKVDLGDDF